MLTEYALLKLQAINGEEQYVHALPLLLGSKKAKDSKVTPQPDYRVEVLAITNIIDTFHYHALVFYHEGVYKIIAITPLIVNSKLLTLNQRLISLLTTS